MSGEMSVYISVRWMSWRAAAEQSCGNCCCDEAHQSKCSVAVFHTDSATHFIIWPFIIYLFAK